MTEMAEGTQNIPLSMEVPLRKDRNFRWLVLAVHYLPLVIN